MMIPLDDLPNVYFEFGQNFLFLAVFCQLCLFVLVFVVELKIIPDLSFYRSYFEWPEI